MRGFTLIEMLIAIAILAILVATSVGIYRHYFRSAFEVDPVATLLAAKLAQEEYYADHNTYADQIEKLPGFSDDDSDNKYYLNEDKDDRRKFYIEVTNATDESYTLTVKNLTNDEKWQIEWRLTCGFGAAIGSCKPVQIKGSSTFKGVF